MTAKASSTLIKPGLRNLSRRCADLITNHTPTTRSWFEFSWILLFLLNIRMTQGGMASSHRAPWISYRITFPPRFSYASAHVPTSHSTPHPSCSPILRRLSRSEPSASFGKSKTSGQRDQVGYSSSSMCIQRFNIGDISRQMTPELIAISAIIL